MDKRLRMQFLFNQSNVNSINIFSNIKYYFLIPNTNINECPMKLNTRLTENKNKYQYIKSFMKLIIFFIPILKTKNLLIALKNLKLNLLLCEFVFIFWTLFSILLLFDILIIN